MSHQQFQQGAGAAAYNNQATAEESSSLITTNSSPATTTPAPTLPGRQLAKTHPCTWPDCPRFFACPHNVQQHIREKHTHEKPYKCEECVDVAFARQYGLNRHKAQVHGDGEKASRVAADRHTYGVVPSAEPEQPFVPFTEPTQATTGADAKFDESMDFLTEENARNDVSGGNIEMADDQFNFDAYLSETAAVEMPDAQFYFDAAAGDCHCCPQQRAGRWAPWVRRMRLLRDHKRQRENAHARRTPGSQQSPLRVRHLHDAPMLF